MLLLLVGLLWAAQFGVLNSVSETDFACFNKLLLIEQR